MLRRAVYGGFNNPQRRKFKKGMTDPRWFSAPAEIYRETHRRGGFVATAATHKRSNAQIKAAAKGLDKSNVLEIGSGPRPVSAEMKPANLTLVDLLPEHHELARTVIAQNKTSHPNETVDPEKVTYIAADARKSIQQLEGKHFSLIVIAEMLTHVPTAERVRFLADWAKKTDSFVIVDRQVVLKGAIKKHPELMNGKDIRSLISRMGFKCTHFHTETFHQQTENQGVQAQTYFFLAAKRG